MTGREGVEAVRGVVPYIIVPGVDELVDFCVEVFGAIRHGRLLRPDGSVMHVEIDIEGSRIMMGEPMGEFGPAPGMLFVNVDDAEVVFARALAAGAESVMDITRMHHAGERYGGVKDPMGNVWWISTREEDVPWEEQQRRVDALVAQDLGS